MHNFKPIEEKNGKLRSACICGWQVSSLDSTRRSAFQAWQSHMYAKGFRTSTAVNAEIEKARSTNDKQTA